MAERFKLYEFKLYVWENVLQDYAYGIVAVMATSLDEARELGLTQVLSDDDKRAIMESSPEIHAGPVAISRYGSA
jgi:hypothetical protein